MFSRADEAEKVRKEMEHRVNYNEERIEKLEADLISAKKTSRETLEKYDETNRRVGIKEQKLEVALKRAKAAEERVKELEADMAKVASQMGAKESSREKVGKREEAYKKQVGLTYFISLIKRCTASRQSRPRSLCRHHKPKSLKCTFLLRIDKAIGLVHKLSCLLGRFSPRPILRIRFALPMPDQSRHPWSCRCGCRRPCRRHIGLCIGGHLQSCRLHLLRSSRRPKMGLHKYRRLASQNDPDPP